ncbi:MAG: serine hydrolase [Cyclobacteriaceae bacterium]
MNLRIFIFLLPLVFVSCKKDSVTKEEEPETNTDSSLYFPPVGSSEWMRIAPETLGNNIAEIEKLKTFLETNNTRAFILLKDGKIVLEEYFGQNITQTAAFISESPWYWASAGKTITATLTGIAQQEGKLSIEDKTSDYLGTDWTSLNTEQEARITVSHQLTMTTGLDFQVDNIDCTEPSCLQYKNDPGTIWYYHNAPYTLLEKVIESATAMDYNEYTSNKLGDRIGMSGRWIKSGYNNVYWSTARDMARFGLLMLNQGVWDENEMIVNKEYFEEMTSTSQSLNPSYGYLWWLNGKSSIILPSLSTSFNTSLSTNAPTDLRAGMGKNGQFVEIVPSQNIVVVRMGEAPDGSLVPVVFHDQMWEHINEVINP